jgi:hypothetical protein
VAPTNAALFANATALQMLDDSPAWIREDPDFRAVIYAYAKETDLKREKIEEVRRQFHPQTADILLNAWEATFGLPMEPEGVLLGERRDIVLTAMLRVFSGIRLGARWEEIFQSVLPGGSYWEFDPQVSSNPVAPHTIRIYVPFVFGSDAFMRVERVLRKGLPANTQLQLLSEDVFVEDISGLDIDKLV